MTPADLNLTAETQAEYRARDGEYLTSTLLKTSLDSLRLFQQTRAGEVEKEYKKEWRIGTAAHTLILEGGLVYHGRHNILKTPSARREKGDKETLSMAEDKLVTIMRGEFYRHPVAPELIRSGFPELVARAIYCGYPCQVKVDWLHFGLMWDGVPCNALIDYKTCQDIKWFESDAWKMRYRNSFSFYKEVLNEAFRKARLPQYCIDRVITIAQEKKPPYTVGVWEVDIQVLETARLENEEAIIEIMQCEASGVWPTGYENVRTMELLKRR